MSKAIHAKSFDKFEYDTLEKFNALVQRYDSLMNEFNEKDRYHGKYTPDMIIAMSDIYDQTSELNKLLYETFVTGYEKGHEFWTASDTDIKICTYRLNALYKMVNEFYSSILEEEDHYFGRKNVISLFKDYASNIKNIKVKDVASPNVKNRRYKGDIYHPDDLKHIRSVQVGDTYRHFETYGELKSEKRYMWNGDEWEDLGYVWNFHN